MAIYMRSQLLLGEETSLVFTPRLSDSTCKENGQTHASKLDRGGEVNELEVVSGTIRYIISVRHHGYQECRASLPRCLRLIAVA